MGCSQCPTDENKMNENKNNWNKKNNKVKKGINISVSGISISNIEERKEFNDILFQKKEIVKENENKSNQEQEEKKGDENKFNQEQKEEKKGDENKSNHEQEKKKGDENKFNQEQKEEKKENENKFNQEQEEKKENEIISLSNNIKDSEKYDNQLFKIKKMGNFVYCQNSIHMFLIDGEPLKKYNYFKIDFTRCNYIFIVPEQFCDMFSRFYSYRLKNSIIFFPKDYKQAKDLLNDLDNEEGTEENWIIICPCMELENNIQTLNENKNIYHIIAYCPFFDHDDKHNFKFFVKFHKFYGIVNDYNVLITKLFKLNNIFYFRKKQKYEIDNNVNNILELKYDTKYLIDYHNDCSKNSATDDKLLEFYNFKIKDDNCYFAFIQSYTFLNNCIEEKKFDLLYNIFENLSGILMISNDELEKALLATNILKNLH